MLIKKLYELAITLIAEVEINNNETGKRLKGLLVRQIIRTGYY